MKFGKRYSKVTVFMAMLQGVVIGVAAVALIAVILMGTNWKNGDKEPVGKDDELPITGPAPVDTVTTVPITHQPLQFFARQHGVFTTPSSAATFIAQEPTLVSAAIVKAEGQYYVWTSIGKTELEIMDSEIGGTFRKKIVADTSACSAIGAGKLQSVLQATERDKINLLEVEKEADLAAEFNRNLAAITTYSNDMRIIRLHLLSYYSTTKECVKISF